MFFQQLFQVLPVERDNLKVLLGQNVKVYLPSVKPTFLDIIFEKFQKYSQSDLPLRIFLKIYKIMSKKVPLTHRSRDFKFCPSKTFKLSLSTGRTWKSC